MNYMSIAILSECNSHISFSHFQIIMSEVVGSQSVEEMEEKFEAIQETIQNLQSEYTSKSIEMIFNVRSSLNNDFVMESRGTEKETTNCDECKSNDAVEVEKLPNELGKSISDIKMAALGHELLQLQIEINKKFCQLRSVCKDEDAVKKFKDLFYGFAANGFIMKEVVMEMIVSEIRKNDEFPNEMAGYMPELQSVLKQLTVSETSAVADDTNEQKVPAIKPNDKIANEFEILSEDLLQLMLRASADVSANGDAVHDQSNAELAIRSTGGIFSELLGDMKQLMDSSKTVMDCVFGDVVNDNNVNDNNDTKSAE